MPVISVSNETLVRLRRLKGKLISVSGREVSFDDAIRWLLDKHEKEVR